MQNEVIEYVKQYAMITLSISIMSVGVYFFKFPNNFVFGGVTGMAALAAKLTPLSASAFSSAANMILLGVGLIFLGKKFAMTTGYATVVMSLELMALEKIKMCKAILIVCDDRKPICDFVMRKLMRGATYTPCFGAYTDKPHYIIYTTLTRREADQLQDFIHKQHLNAFMSMLSTTEVFGKGFNHA